MRPVERERTDESIGEDDIQNGIIPYSNSSLSFDILCHGQPSFIVTDDGEMNVSYWGHWRPIRSCGFIVDAREVLWDC